MRESELKHLVESSIGQFLQVGAKSAYAMAFRSQGLPCKGYRLDAPIVAHQLIVNEAAQLLSFLVMDLNTYVALAGRRFPGLDRSEAVKLLIGLNNEILTSVSNRLAPLLPKGGATITPPLVMNYSGDQSMDIQGEDCILQECKSQDFGFQFIAALSLV